MNPCALCRWIGSAPPGAFSTVIINTSLPGASVRSFDMCGVTSAACDIDAPVIRPSNTNTSVLLFLTDLSFVIMNLLLCDRPSSGQVNLRGILGSVLSCTSYSPAFSRLIHSRMYGEQ